MVACLDIDECKIGTHDCDLNATCHNTNGSYLCECNVGYTGNGTYCHDLKECKYGHECHTNATCHETEGSYFCVCDTGYTGDGWNCSGKNYVDTLA